MMNDDVDSQEKKKLAHTVNDASEDIISDIQSRINDYAFKILLLRGSLNYHSKLIGNTNSAETLLKTILHNLYDAIQIANQLNLDHPLNDIQPRIKATINNEYQYGFFVDFAFIIQSLALLKKENYSPFLQGPITSYPYLGCFLEGFIAEVIKDILQKISQEIINFLSEKIILEVRKAALQNIDNNDSAYLLEFLNKFIENENISNILELIDDLNEDNNALVKDLKQPLTNLLLKLGVSNVIQGENSKKTKQKNEIKNLLEKDFSKIDVIRLNGLDVNLCNFFINQYNKLDQFYTLLNRLTHYYSKNAYNARNQELDKIITITENICNPEQVAGQLNKIIKKFNKPEYMVFYGVSGDKRQKRNDVLNIVEELRNISQLLCGTEIYLEKKEKQVEEYQQQPRFSKNFSHNNYHIEQVSMFNKSTLQYNDGLDNDFDYDLVIKKIEVNFSNLKKGITPNVYISNCSRRMAILTSINSIMLNAENKEPSYLIEKFETYKTHIDKQYSSREWGKTMISFLESSIAALENLSNKNIELVFSKSLKSKRFGYI